MASATVAGWTRSWQQPLGMFAFQLCEHPGQTEKYAGPGQRKELCQRAQLESVLIGTIWQKRQTDQNETWMNRWCHQ